MRIIAVDVDPQALRYIRDALIKSGFAPIVTPDPEDALRLVEEDKGTQRRMAWMLLAGMQS